MKITLKSAIFYTGAFTLYGTILPLVRNFTLENINE